MPKKKGRYPSQIRYDLENPPLTIRVTKEIRNTLNEIKKEVKKKKGVKITKGELVSDALRRYSKSYRRGYDKGVEEGRDRAEALFRITVPCFVCGKPIEITKNDAIYKDIKKKYTSWAHVRHK